MAVSNLSDRRLDGATVMPIFMGGHEPKFDESKLTIDEVPIICLRDVVMFPKVTIPVLLGRAKSINVAKSAEKSGRYVGIICQKDSSVDDPEEKDLYQVGCLAEVMKSIEMPDGNINVFLMGSKSFRVKSFNQMEPVVTASIELDSESEATYDEQTLRALISNIKEDVDEYDSQEESNLPPEVQFALNNIHDNIFLINFLSAVFPMTPDRRQFLLDVSNIPSRGRQLAYEISSGLQFAKLKSRLHNETQATLSKMQRNAYLQNQINTLQEELGEGHNSELAELEKKGRRLLSGAPEGKAFAKGIKKLHRMSESSPDYSIEYNYLHTLADLPWEYVPQDSLNMTRAKRILDRDHFGLEKVKERILEHLAVLKMNCFKKAPILCLVGPPGVGKTSLGRSIADALNRSYVRVSLGGLHDEAEIRGHRRTYIGAMPGRIISGLIKAGHDNPVFVLDEIDKISNDFRGDPASALLEVLDPEQNASFHDNYLDLDYDLSHVLFIATANDLAPIAPPLRDRMEIIDLSGYILEEKVEIGERHLLPKQRRENGLYDIKFGIPHATMERIIDMYTRESGVRQLDKCLAKVMRKVAYKVAKGETVPQKLKPSDLQEYLGVPGYDSEKYEGNDYAGVVTGLAWTSVGGTILMVESSLSKSKGEKLTLTGNLGDVMKESATLALQWVKANADYLEIPEEVFNNYAVHIHCPEGAIPKDGPSAGVTMVTSLASSFTQRRVRDHIAMTGEITLRGRVIPIGGVKEKILAAKRAGITDLVLCVDNRKDVEDIPQQYLSGLTFHYVSDVKEVIDYALLPEKVKNPKKLF